MTMKLQLSIFGFLCCVISMAHSESIQFEDCSALGYKVKSVDISPCPVSPCEFPSGSNVIVKAIYEVENNEACQYSLESETYIYPKSFDNTKDAFQQLPPGGIGNLTEELVKKLVGVKLNPGRLNGITYPIPDSTSSHFPTPICPGETTEFSQTFEISSNFPKMSGTVEGLKVDKTGRTIFCFNFLAAIV